MAHFAKVEGGFVTDVLVISQDEVDTGMFGDPSLWIKTSYNTRGGVHYNQQGEPDGPGLRKNYAGIGYIYDPVLDAFIPPKPYPSWLLNTETCLWEAPVPYPTDGELYMWDEATLSWVLVEPQPPAPVVEEPSPMATGPSPMVTEPETPVVEAVLSTVTSSLGG